MTDVVVTCTHCGTEFRPLRRSARFCGPTCRVAAHRGRGVCNATTATAAAAGAKNGKIRSTIHAAPKDAISVTLRRPPKLPAGIVPDAKWPGMYRIRRPDGTLSDMVNLTRAKDVCASLVVSRRRVP